MRGELVDAIVKSNNDNSIGAIIMTGAGKGFCAGADMQATFKSRMNGENPEKAALDKTETESQTVDWVDLVRSSKPLIAAVNGAAVGVGLTQILPFDVIMASDKAIFGMFFIKMGIVPELASTYFLVQRMGFGKASEMALSGRLYGAQEAFDKGLADRIVPHAKLMDEAFAVAKEIAANPVPQLIMIKKLITQNGSETDLQLVASREHELLEYCYNTPEHKEAVSAFLEKRPPKFR
jgi:enoyl-CoA hydratase/carnithine racemase